MHLSLPFSRLNSPSSLTLTADVFHCLDHFGGPSLDSLQCVQVSLVLGAQHWNQHFRCGVPSAEERGEIALLGLLTMFASCSPEYHWPS